MLKEGCHWVVDADLKSYFDSIPHTRLMEEVRKYIADGRALDLHAKYLKQEIFDGLQRWRPGQGTPQGAVMTPRTQKITWHVLPSCVIIKI
jgi:RNA-directed DNA polymerase